jgi:DNA-binding IclR family transcriptional regulator
VTASQTVKSADRVSAILTALSHADLLHSEIAAALNFPKSSVSGLLTTLQEAKLVDFDEATKRYSLGPQILILAGRYLDRFDLASRGQPIVDGLAASTGESAALCVPRGPIFLVVAKRNAERPVMRSMQIGEQGGMSISAAGRAILAFLDRSQVTEILRREREETNLRTNPHKLLAELVLVQQHGVAFSRDEIVDGISGLAAPVLDAFGKSVAALSVAIPTTRYSEAIEHKVVAALQVASSALSGTLGGVAPTLSPPSSAIKIASLRTKKNGNVT